VDNIKFLSYLLNHVLVMTQSLWKKLTVWTDNQNDDKVKINVAKKKQEI